MFMNPFMIKELRKAIMNRSRMRNKYLKCPSKENFVIKKKMKNKYNFICKKNLIVLHCFGKKSQKVKLKVPAL